MAAQLISTAASITATNEEGKEIIKALKVFISQIDTKTLIDLSVVVKEDPSLIKKAMQYKGFIGI